MSVIKKIISIISIFIILIFPAKAQEMIGLVNSNYSGINSLTINPGYITNSKLYLDINIFSTNVFVENNFIYLSKNDYKFSRFFENKPQFPKHGEKQNYITYCFYNKENKNAYINFRFNGPSVMLSIGHHSFAIHSAIRTASSLQQLPYHIGNFMHHGITYEPQQNIDFNTIGFQASEISFLETGLTYAYIFSERNRNEWSAGITVKKLFGLSGAYINNYNSDYEVINDSTLIVSNSNAEYGYSLPVDYNNNKYSPYKQSLIKGSGFGIDLGISYQKNVHSGTNKYISKLCKQKYIDYHYKIGFSILDIGKIKFKKKVNRYIFGNVYTYWQGIDTFEFKNFNQFDSTIFSHFHKESNDIITKNEFTIFLPSAFSLQFDYHLYKNLYFNATFIKSLNLGKLYVRRPTILFFTPRYESKYFEIDIPFSIYEMKYPRVGVSMRIWNLTIGTEKISGFFNYKNFTGLDFYASLNINFEKGLCNNKLFHFKRRSPCYFNNFK